MLQKTNGSLYSCIHKYTTKFSVIQYLSEIKQEEYEIEAMQNEEKREIEKIYRVNKFEGDELKK
jgi:hypothetical protein